MSESPWGDLPLTPEQEKRVREIVHEIVFYKRFVISDIDGKVTARTGEAKPSAVKP